VAGHRDPPAGSTGGRSVGMENSSWHSPLGKILRLHQGDIPRLACDAIVNAANSQLAGGGGVDGAIHAAAGPSVMAELARIRTARGRCPAGQAVVTGAGRLQARYIIHAVGPVYRTGDAEQAELLASCYREAFRLAAGRGATCIAFPAISTGVYGYPVDEAATIALSMAKEFLARPSPIQEAILVAFNEDSLKAYSRVI
jgi:O-acetyl-ADP-ribose deacetylase